MKKVGPPFTTVKPGQGLAEYGIVIALVAVVCIPGIMLLGDVLGAGCQTMLGHLGIPGANAPASEQEAGAPPPAEEVASASPPATPAPGGTVTPPPNGFSFKTKDGTVINVPDYPKSFREIIETSGANGTTTMLASNILNVADQLLASGQITQEQYNAFVKLSNKGHEIAEINGLIEDAVAGAKSGKDLGKTKVTFNGKTYTIDKFTDIHDFNTNTNNATVVTDPLNDKRADGALKEFNALYKELANSGALSDPSVKMIVDDMSARILQTTELVSCLTCEISGGDRPLDNFRQQLATKPSHLYSATICTTGGAKDSGVYCSAN